MIHEYALEPEAVVELLRNRESFRCLYKEFGVGTPRLMAELPKFNKWKSKFCRTIDSLSLSEFEEKRAEEILKKFKCDNGRILRTGGSDYDGNCTWLENAEKENQRHKFTAIIANSNPRSINNVLLTDHFSERPDGLWNFEDRIIVERTTEAMSYAVASLVQKASEIIFIDPHFDPGDERYNCRYWKPLVAWLKEAISSSAYPPKKRIELQASDKITYTSFRRQCDEHVSNKIPYGLEVLVKRWKTNRQFHNRYILTNLGGIYFGHGLDEGKPGEIDDLTLLSRDQWNVRWNQYSGATEPFELENKFTIKGTGKH